MACKIKKLRKVGARCVCGGKFRKMSACGRKGKSAGKKSKKSKKH